MTRHSTVASVTALLLVLAGTSQAAVLYEINPWIIPPGTARYPVINATCGDALQFGWSTKDGEQGVFKLQNSTCPTTFDNSTGHKVAAVAAGPGNITYIVQNEAPFYITSQAGNGANCNQAQILAINATCPPEALANLSIINAAIAATPGAYGGGATPGAYGAATPGAYGGAATPGAYERAAPSGAGGYGISAAPGGYGGH